MPRGRDAASRQWTRSLDRVMPLIVAEYHSRRSTRQLAKRFSITQPAMHKRLQKHGAKMRPAHGHTENDIDALWPLIATAFKAGATGKDLAAEYACSEPTMLKRLRAHGLLPRPIKAKYRSIRDPRTGEVINVHRFVYETEVGPIPEGYHVHHKNGDTWDNRPENLAAMSAGDHTRLHNKRRPRLAPV